jgi:T5SS/PEP-CTERM-associated repeat protein
MQLWMPKLLVPRTLQQCPAGRIFCQRFPFVTIRLLSGSNIILSLGIAVCAGPVAKAQVFGGDDVGPPNVIIGNSGAGTLSIGNSSVLSDTSANIANAHGSNGSVTVGGAGSTWTNSNYLLVGYAGTGSLAISNGGKVSVAANGLGTAIGYNAGSSGTVTVDGVGSNWSNSGGLTVGNSGTGSLTITNGGSVTDFVLGFKIGSVAGGQGTVIVDGAGSSFTNSSGGSVGVSGNGSLTLSNSGLFTVKNGTGTATLGMNSTGVGTVNIGGTVAGPAKAGGILDAKSVTTGTGSGALQFNTTSTSSNPYYFTNNGTSSGSAIAITGPTQLTNTGGFNVLTGTNTYTGTTTVNGGTLDIAAGATIDATAVKLNGGTIQDDGTLDPPSIDVYATATLDGTGTILGDISNAGTVILGDSASGPGTLSETGNYGQSAGGALVEGIDSATDYGHFDVTGNVTLGGSLDIDLVGGFDPTHGETFDLIDYSGTESGAFAPIADWTVVYDASGINNGHEVEIEYVPDAASTLGLLSLAFSVLALVRQKLS